VVSTIGWQKGSSNLFRLGPGKTANIKTILDPPKGQEGSGIGKIHTLDSPILFEELASRVKSYLGLEYLRVAKATGTVANVGICAGSGSGVLSKCNQVDVFLTGEMSHHEILDANSKGTSVILCEHSNSERGFLEQVLKPRLQALLPGQEIVCSKQDRDPLTLFQ
jgi:putative NIF3 family GTP cyclohydrolase 1 type 2